MTFETPPKNDLFWKQISECLSTLKYSSFNKSLMHVIIGWNIHESKYNIANIILILACYSIYKFKMIYQETKKDVPIFLLFRTEIKKLNVLISNSKKRQNISITETKEWDNLKTYLNII